MLIAQAAEIAKPVSESIAGMPGGWMVATVAMVLFFVGWMHVHAIKRVGDGMSEIAKSTRQAGGKMAKAIAAHHAETQAKIDALPCANDQPVAARIAELEGSGVRAAKGRR